MRIVHGGISVTPERVAEVTAEGATFQKLCAQEDGCVEYQLSWKLGEDENLRLLEIWDTADDHETHKLQPHTVAWTAFISGAAAAPPGFTQYDV
ncbi:putative quinol monooxygenase [Kineosporia succinea]|uniref:Quinol monooxygenase YgiN n=1 Tax=Kineosporia succinea TaxID=84632 RepID=A0ABT9PAR8_9ACTN|nr:antibiotic biosynthesis monooxygenase family protein [Kineosporia succinea]MDP9829780.1 quinol monooxygenase YgiN [Kineosporia succinea]